MSHAEDRDRSPIWGLLRVVLGGLLFVPVWAGLNFAVGTALDGPVGVIVMDPPCQRLLQRVGRSPERLDRYQIGGRRTPSVCHFASRSIRVGDGPTDGLGFTERELVYLAIQFAGLAACFAGALALAFILVTIGWRFVRRTLGARKPSGS